MDGSIVCATLTSHENTVWSIAFNKSGDRLASASEDNTVKIWKEYKPGNSEGNIDYSKYILVSRSIAYWLHYVTRLKSLSVS